VFGINQQARSVRSAPADPRTPDGAGPRQPGRRG